MIKNILVLSQNEEFSKNVIMCFEGNNHYRYFLVGPEKTNKNFTGSNLFEKVAYTRNSLANLNKESENLEDILNYITLFNIDIVTPSDFDSLKFISGNYESISDSTFVTPLPDINKITTLDNKSTCCRLMVLNGVLLPKTIYGTQGESYNNIAVELKFPLICKSDTGSGGNGVEKINTIHELKVAFESHEKSEGNVLFQEYVDGIDYCYNAYSVNGEIKAWTLFRYVYLKNKKSIGEVAEFVLDEKIRLEGERIVRATNYTGPIVIDFRKSSIDNEIYFIEINPRFGDNTNYSIISGVNFVDVGLKLTYDFGYIESARHYGYWSCSLKRLFTAPVRCLDLQSFYYIFKVGFPQIKFIISQHKKVNKSFLWKS